MKKYERCSVEDCGRPGIKDSDGVRYFARGYCGMHYTRFMKTGDPLSRVRGEKNTSVDHGGKTYIDLRNRRTDIVAVAVISISDKEKVLQHTWCLSADTYAVARIEDRVVRLHRFLLPEAKVVDHINRNTLDNTRDNLRPCTYAQNARNKSKKRGKTSRYHGVSLHRGYWAIYKSFPGVKRRFWGYFPTEVAAAVEYNRLVSTHGDEFSPLNTI